MISFEYEQLFNDHMKIAKDKFIQKNEREPNLEEQLDEYVEIMEYFYD